MTIQYDEGSGIPDENGDILWLVNRQYHRLDGPALILSSGYREWCLNGKLHRLDGPAVIWASGIKEWYIEGKLIQHQIINPIIGQAFTLVGNNDDAGITLRYVEGVFWEILLGNKKIIAYCC